MTSPFIPVITRTSSASKPLITLVTTTSASTPSVTPTTETQAMNERKPSELFERRNRLASIQTAETGRLMARLSVSRRLARSRSI